MVRRAVLLGAGHAHLFTLKRTADFVRAGFELVLVAPEVFWYSGLATGVLAGIYPPELDQIDVGALVARGGGRFVRARATAIDVAARTVALDDGSTLSYDVLSCNLGSEVPLEAVPGAATFGHAVKPVRNLWELRQSLEARMSAAPGEEMRVVIVGGGATGCEIAANVQHLVASHGGRARITVLARGDSLLSDMPRGAARKMERILERRGVRVMLHSPVVRVDSQAVRTADGGQVPYDFLVHAMGLTPSPILRATGLPTSADGALLVDPFLRSVADPRIFGGGDCIALEGHDLAKIGVYAVRESPVICHNLLATLQGQPLERFRPQRRYLLILNLGDSTGLLTWGKLSWHSRLAFRLKDRIDRAFLREYQVPGQDRS
jgi:NADH dehydrogenase FAD-containing subunit